VLLAIGLPHEIAHGSLRLTLGEDTTREDIDYTVEAIKEVVERLRQMSPLFEDFVQGKKALSAIR
jgi:cysteine desulfurase